MIFFTYMTCLTYDCLRPPWYIVPTPLYTTALLLLLHISRILPLPFNHHHSETKCSSPRDFTSYALFICIHFIKQFYIQNCIGAHQYSVLELRKCIQMILDSTCKNAALKESLIWILERTLKGNIHSHLQSKGQLVLSKFVGLECESVKSYQSKIEE